MKPLFKALIVWLMLVAIPFQGFAAASMLTCAPVKVAAGMTAEHCAMMATASHHDAAAPGEQPGHPASSDHHSKCNTCASCCFGAVMAPPVPVVRVPGDTPELAAFHFEDGNVERVDLALPERPPKAS